MHTQPFLIPCGSLVGSHYIDIYTDMSVVLGLDSRYVCSLSMDAGRHPPDPFERADQYKPKIRHPSNQGA